MHCDEQGNMSSLLGKAASSAGADEEVEPMVQLLLDCGALADAIDHTRITALTHATEMQTLGVINMLLDRGANPIFGLGEMITPLEMAAREFQSDLLRKLLDMMITRKLKFDNIPILLPSALSSSLSLSPGWNLVSEPDYECPHKSGGS
jgi:ankyrin repeat protein